VIAARFPAGIAPAIREWWTRRNAVCWRLGIGVMLLGALWRVGSELPRLLWAEGYWEAGDLKFRHQEVARWFAGLPVYGVLQKADYPPATYAILWPFLGWLSLPHARELWAITMVLAIGGLAYLSMRESGASARLPAVFVALLACAMYPASSAIRMGQLTYHVLLALLVGLFLLRRRPVGGWTDLAVATLLVFALVKPTVSAPFLWLVLFVPGRLRPIVLIASAYVALTVLAGAFQDASLPALLQAWVKQKELVNVRGGYANLSGWLTAVGLEKWLLPAALLVLAGLGLWSWLHRRVDLWLQIGVTALVARLWIHHRVHDDLLILLPLIALFRLATRGPSPDGSDVTAGVLFAITWGAMLIPTGLVVHSRPMFAVVIAGLGALWLVVLAFLLRRAWIERKNLGAEAA
jgi:hypothetical protein